MASTPKPLNRQQLSSFLKDSESILRFQQLFVQAGETLPADIEIINENLEELEFLLMTRIPC